MGESYIANRARFSRSRVRERPCALCYSLGALRAFFGSAPIPTAPNRARPHGRWVIEFKINQLLVFLFPKNFCISQLQKPGICQGPFWQLIPKKASSVTNNQKNKWSQKLIFCPGDLPLKRPRLYSGREMVEAATVDLQPAS